ncbi:MAG: tRNA-dihydrouridine synthase family protein [Lachnospiraceae bacterium]|nr:tRNA-dihydrouridine synthase family protein [Lachnospiraceae bacterium]
MNPRIMMAPMEGITTATYRRIYKKHFSGVDVFFTPFLVANQTHKFKHREKNEFQPFDEDLVPQLLTNSVEDFIWGAKELKSAGYNEINFNLGCPASTVVTKKKGAGMLSDTDRLIRFFDEIFDVKEKENLPDISVKTRIGMTDISETEDLAEIYPKYPFSEVIIHPRLRSDFYEGQPRMEQFDLLYSAIRNGAASKRTRIIYNGDIYDVNDYQRIMECYPDIDGIMMGRGLIIDPLLTEKIRGIENGRVKERIYAFINELYDAYSEILSGERDVLFKMKDIAMYMTLNLPENAKVRKVIKKARNREEYMLWPEEL